MDTYIHNSGKLSHLFDLLPSSFLYSQFLEFLLVECKITAGSVLFHC